MELPLILFGVHISPQFYVKHDPSFDVVQQQSFNSNWQNKAGIVTRREQQIEKKEKVTILKQVLQQDKKVLSSKHKKAQGQAASKKRNITFADRKRFKVSKDNNS